MKLVHLVYIHGFQGNDSTFQSFPLDLQQHLSARIPAHLDLNIRSSLYPTYKSAKSISFATRNFLEWLSTQPPGPVILLGHSMGGLLAAEAATDPSNAPGSYPSTKPRRIVGVIAFDCPYLGMHPHVVVTGLASLFPKSGEAGKSESELNRHPQVSIVDGEVTEDWEAYKQNENAQANPASRPPNSVLHSSSSGSSVRPPSHSSLKDEWESFRQGSNVQPRSGSLSLSSRSASSSNRSPRSFVDNALSFISTHSDHPVVIWARKHADKPFTEGKRWVIERFQFGSCMFEPIKLKDRYTQLVAWQGVWVNYWTQTVPKGDHSPEADETRMNQQVADNDAALLEADVLQSSSVPTAGQTPSSSSKNLQRQRQARIKNEEKKSAARPGRHFVVLPTGLGEVLGGTDNWEKVVIAGAADEVAAHTGLFIQDHNLNYEGFVERVGNKVLGWCEGL